MTDALAYITRCARTGTPIDLRHIVSITGLTGLQADLLVRRTLAVLADEGVRSREVRTVEHNGRIGDGVRRACERRKQATTA